MAEVCSKNGFTFRILILIGLFGVSVFFIVFENLWDYVYSGKSTNTLKAVHVIFRHGECTPNKNSSFPTDRYANFTYFPYGRGNITSVGMLRIYSLGEQLHSRYHNMLDDKFTPHLIEALSTNEDCNKMSLNAILDGLFSSKWTWEEDIQYDVLSSKTDPILLGHYICPKVQPIINKIIEEEKVKEELLKVFKYEEDIYNITGVNISSSRFFGHNLYSTLESQINYGLDLPDSFLHAFKNLSRISRFMNKLFTYNSDITRITVGGLIKLIVEETWKHIHRQKAPKIYLYSAYDTNLAVLLNVFGIFKNTLPEFGSYMLLELHLVNGEYQVKIFYQQKSSLQPVEYEIPICTQSCPFDIFEELYDTYIMEDDDCK